MYNTILHFPIWQGAGAPHGYRRGAGVLRHIAQGYRPVVDIPVDDSDFSATVGKVKALDTLQRHFSVAQEILRQQTQPVFTIGGDCVADFIPLAHALETHGDKVAVLWVDAHPDINTPETSPSGNFHGMLLRTLMGEGPVGYQSFVPHHLKPRQLFYAGLRDADMDAEEFRIIAAEHIFRLDVPEIMAHRWQRLFAAIEAGGFTHVHLHVDSDVMDLTDYPQAVVAVPGGVSADALVAFLQAVRAHFPLAGAALTEYSLEQSAGPAEEALGRRLLVEGLGIA